MGNEKAPRDESNSSGNAAIDRAGTELHQKPRPHTQQPPALCIYPALGPGLSPTAPWPHRILPTSAPLPLRKLRLREDTPRPTEPGPPRGAPNPHPGTGPNGSTPLFSAQAPLTRITCLPGPSHPIDDTPGGRGLPSRHVAGRAGEGADSWGACVLSMAPGSPEELHL